MTIEEAAQTLTAKLTGAPWFMHVLVGEITPPGRAEGLIVYVKSEPPEADKLPPPYVWEGYGVVYRHFGANR